MVCCISIPFFYGFARAVFEETVNLKKNEIAVVEGEEKVSFVELRRRAMDLAGYFSERIEIMASSPVAVFIPKSVWGIVADMGILYSGNAYMNLDVKTPAHRIENILDCVKPAAIITHSKYLEKLPETHIDIICIDKIEMKQNQIDFMKMQSQKIIDTDPMCLINTSGSTGTPKGVVLNHKSFIDFTEWALDTFEFNHKGAIGLNADLSKRETFDLILKLLVHFHRQYLIFIVLNFAC